MLQLVFLLGYITGYIIGVCLKTYQDFNSYNNDMAENKIYRRGGIV